MTTLSADEAIKKIQSGQRVFVQGSAATPLHLLKSLEKRAEELNSVELVNISMLGDIGINKPEYSKSFYFNSLFVSAPIRKNVNESNGDYIPVFLSEIHLLFDRNVLPLDVALIHVSPPDHHGYCSLGVSVDITRSALRNAKHVIAQVNPQMPRTHGDGMIHVSRIDTFVEVDEALPEVNYSDAVTDCERTIGKNVASLIDDYATLQMGIGTIPDAVLDCLSGHKEIGIHTEMFSDGVVDLMQKGVITNKYKKKHRNKTATAFAIGTRKLYDFVDDNPAFSFLEAGYVNDGKVIRSNPNVVAINSAIEIDITGQVCADSIGTKQYSGVGGQMDFIRGAALSENGKPIIAMSSTTGKGISKITPFLKQGAGVVTTRSHVHYVVTEYGIANLFGKNLSQRAKELIRIAHPDHREELEKAAFERFK
ncbi:MAG: acetyl-CoA hydrolase/transferase family protein [Chitinophagaceae bacterium]|nr:MAG: acetyl-CoA hydrolase/transferase family protein [Chitinophagaceae bacterium]